MLLTTGSKSNKAPVDGGFDRSARTGKVRREESSTADGPSVRSATTMPDGGFPSKSYVDESSASSKTTKPRASSKATMTNKACSDVNATHHGRAPASRLKATKSHHSHTGVTNCRSLKIAGRRSSPIITVCRPEKRREERSRFLDMSALVCRLKSRHIAGAL